MKKFEFIVAALALVAGVMFCSCVKDETDTLPLHDQHQIDFTASSDAEWLNATRADEEEEPQVMILELEGDEDLEQPLYLHITCEDRKEPTAEELGMEATRGTVITTDNIAQKYGTNGFGLFAYVYKGEWNDSRTSDYIHNDTVRYHTNTGKWHVHNYVEKNANGKPAYTPEDYYYWPGKNYNVRFFAYAPHDAHYGLCILNIPESPYIGAPDIDFLLSNNNIDQFDLCVAKTEQYSGDHNQTVALNFKHVLSAIDFVADEYMPKGVINNIWLVNMLRQDNYNFETGKWAGVEQYAGSKDIQFKSNYTVTLPGNKETKVTDTSTNSTFFVIPHELANNAAIQIAFTPEGSSKTDTLRTNLPKMTWEMGKHYTITISPKVVSSQYVFEVSAPNKTSANYLGIVDGHATSHWTTGNVLSYRIDTYRYGRQEKVPVKWVTEFSTDNGTTWTTTRPAMFPNFTIGGSGCLDTAEELDKYGANFAPIVPDDPANPFGNDISKRPERDNVGDLYAHSNNSTANCYVIDTAGMYKFPLVYGNAIKDGNQNKDSYTGVANVSGALSSFPDYQNAPIQSPYIPDKYLTNAVAELLWCDAPGLITDVTLSTATQTMDVVGTPVRYITFRVPKENITPGNAVIALYDKKPTNDPATSGKIIWSWHIWVTKWNPDTDFVEITSNNIKFKFATEALGYCPARKATWKERSVSVRFKQLESNNYSSTFTFNQTQNTIQYSEGNMPYYQWGRKDPLLPYNYYTTTSVTSTSGTEKTCFFASHIPLTTINDMYVWDSSQGKNVAQYDYSGYFGIENKTGASSDVTIATSIQNPHVFYARHDSTPKADGTEYDWCSEGRLNRWDATNKSDSASKLKDDTSGVKTIYDPCPAGWHVPPSGAWSATVNAGGGTNAAKANTYGEYPYSNDSSPAFKITVQSKVLIYPFTGDRNRYNGAPWWDTYKARCVEYWVATPAQKSTTYTGCSLYVATGSTAMSNGGAMGMSSGLAVLPVKE